MKELKQRKAFEEVLAHYRMSDTSRATLQATKLVLLAASTAAGRNTLIHEILKTGEYYYIVSDTTREPRINNGQLEKNGLVYWFRSEDDMLADLRAGKFLEAAIIHGLQVSGISIREVEQAKNEGKIAITDIEIVGVETIMEAKPDARAIFILPPSFEAWQQRIQARGTMHSQVYKHRMESAVKEFAAALEHDYYCFVINNDLHEAAERIHQIATANQLDQAYQLKARQLTEQLLARTKALIIELSNTPLGS